MTKPMEFVFDERRAAQAAAWLLRRSGAMDGLQLAKLLYLADRHAMCEHGYPITGDRLLCISTGPVLERVFELACESSQQGGSAWSEYVRASDRGRLCATDSDDRGDLSAYDCEVLGRICEQFGAMDSAELGEQVRRLPEWSAPKGGAILIEPQAVLHRAGLNDEELAEIVGQLNAERALAAALGE